MFTQSLQQWKEGTGLSLLKTSLRDIGGGSESDRQVGQKDDVTTRCMGDKGAIQCGVWVLGCKHQTSKQVQEGFTAGKSSPGP